MENNSFSEETSNKALLEYLSDIKANKLSKLDIDSLEATNPLKIYQNLRITDSTDIPKPVPVITINDEIISTEANITTISGASKSGKSAFTSILMAGAISTDGNIDGLESVCVIPNPDGKAVLHFDTEQSRYDHQSNLKSVLRRSGIDNCPDFFQSYNIREADIYSFKKITSCVCKAAFDLFDGIHLIVIDGGADYISDVNDPVKSNDLVKYFEDLAIKYSAPVIIIIHTNPGSDKERGHLGSQFQRKSESVLIVKNDGDISFLEPKFLRKAGKINIPQIQFMYDTDKGYHVGCGIRPDQQSDKNSESFVRAQSLSKLVFGEQKAFKFGVAIYEIMKETTLGESTAKTIFSKMKFNNLIIQGKDKKWRLNDAKE